MKVAVFGCLHGELDEMFKAVERHERDKNCKVELIIVCGDCQTMRHLDDLRCLAVPQKYKRLGDFHNYYAGRKKVPRLTIFVGGNHEASNYLMTLPYGGWICENFYYLGFSTVINYRGFRIGGVSGIYNYHSCNKGRFERMPLDDQSMRTIYHTRRLDVFRLQLLSKNIENNMLDAFLSHDWPARIYDHGNLTQLLRFKPFFRDDMAKREGLGNPLTQPLVHQLKPRRWFAAHLHCKFYAKVVHKSPEGHCTEFLSLNKIESGKQFDEYLDLEPINGKKNIDLVKTGSEVTKEPGVETGTDETDKDNVIDKDDAKSEEDITNKDADANELRYDPEWLTVLRKTVNLEINSRNNVACPNLKDESAESYYPTGEEIQETIEMMNRTGGLEIKKNFRMTEPVIYNRDDGQQPSIDKQRNQYFPNPQHVELCSRLGIPDQIAVASKDASGSVDNRYQGSSSRRNNDRNSTHRPHQNAAYPHRNYQQKTLNPLSRDHSQGHPTKKQALELDEDGCLPFSVDKRGEPSTEQTIS